MELVSAGRLASVVKKLEVVKKVHTRGRVIWDLHCQVLDGELDDEAGGADTGVLHEIGANSLCKAVDWWGPFWSHE